MRAYHGSNKIFDRFDLSRQGEGEGSSLIVKGVNLATNPCVADIYRQKVIIPGSAHTDRCYFSDSGSLSSDDTATIQQLLEVSEDSAAPEAMREKAREALDALGARDPVLMEGAVYEVVVPDRQYLLHWEGSISDQPFDVVEFLRDWYGEDEVEALYEAAMEESPIYDTDYFDQVFESALLRGVGDMQEELSEIAPDFDWERLDKLMGDKCPDLQPDENDVGRALYGTLRHVENGDEGAAKVLAKYGVCGVISTQEFTGFEGQNDIIVIWDEDAIEIKGRLSPDALDMARENVRAKEQRQQTPGMSLGF